jgi:hypothetical protein
VTSGDQELFPLPSNGYRKGDPSMLAKMSGEFHAVKLGGRAEAWLGEDRRPTLWPAGYFVRFGPPVELIAPSGDVVGQEGDVLPWAGGVRNSVVWLQVGPGVSGAD